MSQEKRMEMPVEAALAHLSSRRRDHELVVTNQASARLWPRLSDHPLDFNYNPSTMGGAIPLAVGLAMAKPDYEVIVLSGDGSLLMSLGCLVTVIGSGAKNLSILLLDNAMYEVTGGQKTPASEAAVDFPAMAGATGFRSVKNFESMEEWQSESELLFAAPGPRFARLAVGPTPKEVFDDTLSPIDERVRSFQEAL